MTVALLVAALGGVLVAARFETALACLGVAALCAWRAGAGPPRRGAIAALGTGAALAIVLNLYLVGGRPMPLPRLLGAPATAEGLAQGALLALRLAGAAAALHGLRAAWPGERAADEIAAWLRPLERVRVPVREARAVLGLALRFAPLLAAEHARIARLQALRAGRPPRGPLERIGRMRAALVPTVVAALETAERVSLGLEARHWRLRAPAASNTDPFAAAAGWTLFGIAALWRR